ncbi:ribosome quality control complex subunit NEMF homolog isoform X2 [Pectinophora gossypiella]|nr:ribosome quality control complex subunit NEMF homolog isoform X1 [Pectinophora gossypiella]XP_049878105.1 ribosome quality control complex subunit NEMF homolog isoform X2 [Pectinophora gossypiella]
MKNRFSTYDIVCMVTELQRLIGMRVNQVYDIDNKTYVIRLQRSEEKSVLLLESGNRFHTTQFEWPKNVAPSGFTMKLRKHLKNKRLEKLSQLGVDRIVDLQFGSGEVAFHVILELYDKGNIVLTDHEWTILNVLRPHVEGDKIRFAVKEKYPLDRAKTSHAPPPADALKEIFATSKPQNNLKKILNPKLEYGSSVIDHVLQECGLSGNMKVNREGRGFHPEEQLDTLLAALRLAEDLMEAAKTRVHKGYIIQRREERPSPDGEAPTFLLTNQEFHPLLFAQHKNLPYTEYDTFDRAVDEFFSALEGQKIDMKTIQVEREAMKKLQNVKKDHEKRVTELSRAQQEDCKAAELISRNEPLVEQARTAIQAAIANQMSWDDITELVKAAQDNNDPIASCIKQLKLNTNHITLLLTDPYAAYEDDDDGDGENNDDDDDKLKPMLVDIDLSLTAFANARRYYDQKRNAAKKQQKTLESAGKALKSAERKTKQTLKEAHTISSISKARKTYWFEKFYWYISSDNYLVIGGRDQQQNELLVKRYMRTRDIYVHADLSGASSIVIKNPSGGPVPPRTLSEAGQAAVAYSVAWEAKVMTRAWWVHAHQVSKSAPTGEYLTTGSFMIRGKKNYLLPELMQFGFSFLFRLEDSCIDRHRDERKPITADADTDADAASDVTSLQEDQEIPVSDDDELSDKEASTLRIDSQLDTITEETARIDSLNNSPKREQKEIDVAEDREGEDETEEKEDGQDESDLGSESSSEEFPDTHIKIDHGTGEVIMHSKTRTISEVSDKSEDKPLSFPTLPKKGGKKPQKQEQKKKEEKVEKSAKRGQKGKLKKMKGKYKDQDEEDRAVRMELLQPAKESRKAQKAAAKPHKSKAGARAAKIPAPAPLILEAESDADEPEPEPESEQQGPDADTEMLSQLTGNPFPEDELLFAVPVVAPYSALHNYKFKVKLTPGTSKRGKAAKTAVAVFLKTASPRERDLLKAVREENVARNFPGKVKLSAPQLHKLKK